MKTLARWTLLGTTLMLLACSENGVEPNAMGGAAGVATNGFSGNAAGGSSGNIAGGAVGTAGAAAGTSAGTSMAGGATAGAGGSAAGNAGSANGNAGQTSGGASGNAGSGGGANGGAGGSGSADFKLTSPAFEHVETCTTANRTPCNFFPSANEFTNIGGMNQSPELSWGAGPNGTLSYVVCLHDTTANATHWCLWNIAAATLHLPANLARQKMPTEPAGSSQDGLGLGGSMEGYVGPGARGNVYQFRLYALNVASYSPPNAEDRRTVYAELEQDPNDIVLATSTLRGRANPQQAQ